MIGICVEVRLDETCSIYVGFVRDESISIAKWLPKRDQGIHGCAYIVRCSSALGR